MSMQDASGPSVDPSTVRWHLIRNGLSESVAVKKQKTERKGWGGVMNPNLDQTVVDMYGAD